MTKDCSLQRGQVKKGGGRGLCLRCGRANCNAADYSDWFRCALTPSRQLTVSSTAKQQGHCLMGRCCREAALLEMYQNGCCCA
jgi:hypothetical protein